jgi:hypothetical protein
MAARIAASLATRDPRAGWTPVCTGICLLKKATVFKRRVKCEESAVPRERSTRAKQRSCGVLEYKEGNNFADI